MNERLNEIKARTRKAGGAYNELRREDKIDVTQECEREGLSWSRRISRKLLRFCEAETPVIFPDERIVFARTLPHAGDQMVPEDIRKRCEEEGLRVGFPMENVCADWDMALSQGLLGRREAALAARKRFARDVQATEFLDAAIESIDAVLILTEKYAKAARTLGMEEVAAILARVPAGKPGGFHEALQSLRILHAAVWMSGAMHVGLGRFDQYMWPYMRMDLDAKRLTTEQAEELLAEFFISLNKDSDLYPGVQVGDNGQSLMLGGMKRDGSPGENPLTWMCLRVSRDVNMIDPKLNLRVTSKTNPELLVEAAKLTRMGLGFPQYSNDDVVIPALVAHQYSLEDARDYTVAACWEFIIPGTGMDVPNINALSFPAAVDKAIRQGLAENSEFEKILELTKSNIAEQVNLFINDKRPSKFWPPNPYYSALMTGCLEKGKDFNNGGAKYYNYGIHGSGSTNAADALTAVKTLVFDEDACDRKELLMALESDFQNNPTLRQKLQNCQKSGNDHDLPDLMLKNLFDWFADACEAIPDNGRGGIVRPGSGSAMFYIWLAKKKGMLEPSVGATADGRHEGDYFGCSLAPAPGVLIDGPFSELRTFSAIDFRRICNGGPITMELSDTVFRGDDALSKVGALVRAFATLGCQQLQLNTLNKETLLDARLHPERHKNLIVRVWGWSGYFCELDGEYQNHIIARHCHEF
ncbi:MAG: pyruvate formate lyase family protein [Methylacidiphilales bacterium]|nr:pyruvate formate lyase family protein [Candidatus Methylacidiphilales bacterium]